MLKTVKTVEQLKLIKTVIYQLFHLDTEIVG